MGWGAYRFLRDGCDQCDDEWIVIPMRVKHILGLIMVCVSLGMACALPCRADLASPDERALWRLWAASTNHATDPAAVLEDCKAFIGKSAQDDPLVVVASGQEAWCLLSLGHTNEARRIFTAMLVIPENAMPIAVAGAEMARSWLTRIDREEVKAALKQFYLRDIEYPESLEGIKTLKSVPLPTLMDRWGKSWVYRRESSLKGMNRQQYLLESSRLGPRSDLVKALKIPYAAEIALEPVKPSPASNDIYEFASPNQKSIFLQAGAERDGVSVAYLGMNLIVMSDGNHWRVALKPR